MPSRRVFKERILREARAQATSLSVDLSASIASLTVASSVTATDSFPFITSGGTGYRGTASLIRDYVLSISGGTATIPENLSVQGNTTLGDATTDTITTTGRWVSNAIPLADNLRDLGAVALRWANLYATTVTATNIAGTLTTASQPNVTTMANLTTVGTLVAGAVPASLVTAGTFGAGAYTFPSSLAITGAFSGATTGAFSSNVTIGGTLLSGLGAHTAGSPRATIGGGTIQLVLAENLTDATQKNGRLGFAHYTNAEEPVAGIVVQANSASALLSIGGSSAAFNAATAVQIYTAANATTTTGTRRAYWDSAGAFVQESTALVQGRMQVGNTTLQDPTATSLDQLIVGNVGSGSAGIVIGVGASGSGALSFLEASGTLSGRLLYAQATDTLTFESFTTVNIQPDTLVGGTLAVSGVLTRTGAAALDGSDPVTMLVRSTTNASGWTDGAAWGRYGFWTDDVSGPGAGLRASVDAFTRGTFGSATGIRFRVSDTAALLTAAEFYDNAISFNTSLPITGGTYNGQTISSAASFTGTVAIASTLTSGVHTIAGGSTTNALSVTTTGAINTSLRYDSSNRLDVSVGSTGAIQYAAVGSGAQHGFTNRLVVGGTFTNSSALNVAPTLTATGGVASGILSTPTLTASANADALYGLRVNPGFSVGAFTGTNGYGLFVNSISGAATNYAIFTNTGLVRFGDVVGVAGAAPSTTTALITPASTTGVSSIRLPHGTAPSSPVNGDLWTTTSGLFARVNGTTVQMGDVVGPASATDNAIVRFDGTTGKLVQDSSVTVADDAVMALGMSGASSVFDDADAGIRSYRGGTLVADSENGSRLRIVRTRGTLASPTNVSSASIIGWIDFTGYDGSVVYERSVGTPLGAAYIYASSVNWTSSAHRTTMSIRVLDATDTSYGISIGGSADRRVDVSGDLFVAERAAIFNVNAGDYDFRVSGDTDTNLVFADASTDRVGIGTATPGYKLDVNGSLGINSATLIRTGTSFTNGAGAAAGTLSNAPTAGNPTKWIPIDDNGTTRYIPAW